MREAIVPPDIKWLFTNCVYATLATADDILLGKPLGIHGGDGTNSFLLPGPLRLRSVAL